MDLKELIKSIPNYNPYANADEYYFDSASAQKAISFFHTFLVHVEGAKARTKFILELWQQAVVANIFGWKHKTTNELRYKKVYLTTARKNGKTTLFAGILLYLCFCGKENGAKIYSASASRKQAGIIFDIMSNMIAYDDTLSTKATAYPGYKKIVFDTKEKCSFESLSSEGKSIHGFNPSAVYIDELHCIEDYNYLGALTSGSVARQNPIIFYTTTAGIYKTESPCVKVYDYACKVRDSIIPDSTFLPIIYEASKEDNWIEEETWKKANPNLNVSIYLDNLKTLCKEAQNLSSEENNFRRLHLNQFTQQLDRWIQLDKWNEAPQKEIDIKSLTWFAGLDLSSVSDLTAFVLCAQDKEGYIHTRTFPFIPEENSYLRSLKDKVPYDVWHKEGFIECTNGNVIDYDFIRKRINEISKEYPIKEIACDRWNATQIITQLQSDGFEIVPFGQGFASMSSPSKYLEQLIASKKLIHNNHPVLTWCASNVSIEQDAAENIKPSKDKSTERIDCLVALIMGLGRLIATDTIPQKSVYEDRGVLIF